ncbi:MAG: sigma-70 family RNA polymerase sigma factor [Chloroflexi bacterium]|nr:sigma-70 family RNA polymerase sigma factor [Chloroflexota bacterium]
MGIRKGDPDALEEFYDRTSKQAFGLAYRILGNSASAEDAVQEAYLMIWRQGSKLDPTRGRLKSLLMTIVHRRAIDTLRSERGQRAAGAPEDLDYLAGTSPDPAERVALTMDREDVRSALGSLPADQRSPVELAFFNGLTHVEISEKLGVPLGTVKSRLRLAMGKLRIALGNV